MSRPGEFRRALFRYVGTAIERLPEFSNERGFLLRAEINRFHSPDIADLDSWTPENPKNFGFLLQIFVGPREERGEESFEFIVCTPLWLEDRYSDRSVRLLRNHILVTEFDFAELKVEIRRLVTRLKGDSWDEIAMKLSRYGKWEFEDYEET